MSDLKDLPVVSISDFEAWRQSPAGIALRESLSKTTRELTDAPAEMAGDGWAGRVEGFVPVQGYGTVDGHSWYFRARHGDLQFHVFSGAYTVTQWGVREVPWETEVWEADEREYDGRGSCSGWMYFSEAWETIASFIAEWRATRLQP